MITWIHLPADRANNLPEQWQAKMDEKAVAVMRAAPIGRPRQSVPVLANALGMGLEWQAVLLWPDEMLAVVTMTNVPLHAAKAAVNDSLHDMGWR